MAIETAITIGSEYRDVSDTPTHGSKVRVENVFIDGDGETQVRIDVLTNPDESGRIIDAQTLHGRIESGQIVRINSDHNAWEYRNKI